MQIESFWTVTSEQWTTVCNIFSKYMMFKFYEAQKPYLFHKTLENKM